jgi:tetratricopeptide (TPR) repeat protein
MMSMEKSLKPSLEYKNSGNQLFQGQNFPKALIQYNLALLYSPPETLAIMYQNRSACLFHLNEFQSAIDDIDRAIALNYTNIDKLLQRKSKCIALMPLTESPCKSDVDINYIHPNMQVSKFQCTQRQWILNESVSMGTLLLEEYPFACISNLSMHPHSCLECIRPIYVMHVCHECIYYTCSKECMQLHSKLCKYIKLVSNDLDSLLAFKMYFKNSKNVEIKLLQSHLEKRSDFEIKEFKKNVDLFLSCIPEIEDGSKERDILMHLQGIVKANSFSLKSLHTISCSTNFSQFSQDSFGIGIYPMASIINHSCQPNAIVHFSNSSTVLKLRATKDIKKGEPIVISYGPLSIRHDLNERSSILRKWFFDCGCHACSSKINAPFKRAQKCFSSICNLPFQFGNECQCGYKPCKEQTHHRQTLMNHFNLLWNNSNPFQALEILSSYAHPMSYELAQVYDECAQIKAQSQDYSKALELCKKAVGIIEFLYGYSIEAAQERVKLCGLYMICQEPQKVYISKTLKMFMDLMQEDAEDLQDVLDLREMCNAFRE